MKCKTNSSVTVPSMVNLSLNRLLVIRYRTAQIKW